MKKIKDFLKDNGRMLAGSMLGATTMVATAATTFAAEGEAVNLSETLKTGLNTAANDLIGYIAVILPIGLTVFAAMFGVKKGMKFFKTIAQ